MDIINDNVANNDDMYVASFYKHNYIHNTQSMVALDI